MIYLENIGEYRIGRVVLKQNKYRKEDCNIGHIVGFGVNVFQEATINVQWATGETYEIHPGNVELL